MPRYSPARRKIEIDGEFVEIHEAKQRLETSEGAIPAAEYHRRHGRENVTYNQLALECLSTPLDVYDPIWIEMSVNKFSGNVPSKYFINIRDESTVKDVKVVVGKATAHDFSDLHDSASSLKSFKAFVAEP